MSVSKYYRRLFQALQELQLCWEYANASLAGQDLDIGNQVLISRLLATNLWNNKPAKNATEQNFEEDICEVQELVGGFKGGFSGVKEEHKLIIQEVHAIAQEVHDLYHKGKVPSGAPVVTINKLTTLTNLKMQAGQESMTTLKYWHTQELKVAAASDIFFGKYSQWCTCRFGKAKKVSYDVPI